MQTHGILLFPVACALCLQQQAAARARGIPLLLSPSLRPVDLLLTLRPVLLAHGMVPDTSRSRKVGWCLMEGGSIIRFTLP